MSAMSAVASSTDLLALIALFIDYTLSLKGKGVYWLDMVQVMAPRNNI